MCVTVSCCSVVMSSGLTAECPKVVCKCIAADRCCTERRYGCKPVLQACKRRCVMHVVSTSGQQFCEMNGKYFFYFIFYSNIKYKIT